MNAANAAQRATELRQTANAAKALVERAEAAVVALTVGPELDLELLAGVEILKRAVDTVLDEPNPAFVKYANENLHVTVLNTCSAFTGKLSGRIAAANAAKELAIARAVAAKALQDAAEAELAIVVTERAVLSAAEETAVAAWQDVMTTAIAAAGFTKRSVIQLYRTTEPAGETTGFMKHAGCGFVRAFAPTFFEMFQSAEGYHVAFKVFGGGFNGVGKTDIALWLTRQSDGSVVASPVFDSWAITKPVVAGDNKWIFTSLGATQGYALAIDADGTFDAINRVGVDGRGVGTCELLSVRTLTVSA